MAKVGDISDITKRSKYFFTNSMLCLIKALEGKYITAEIRKECVIQGILLSVDSTMGLTMTKVTMKNVKGETQRLEHFYIQGRHIRYVHIPDEIDILDAMNWQLNKVNVFKDKERQMRNKLFEKKQQKRNLQQMHESKQGDSTHKKVHEQQK